MLHRNIMHHIGALAYCTAPSRTTLVHWYCTAPSCTTLVRCHVAPHHYAPHWCFRIVKSHLIMRNKHAFSVRGCCFKTTHPNFRPPCRRSEAHGKPKLAKNPSPKIFFWKVEWYNPYTFTDNDSHLRYMNQTLRTPLSGLYGLYPPFLLFLILCIFMLSRAQLVRRAQHLNTQLYRQAIVPLRI